MSADKFEGPVGIARFDQDHAEALDRLAKADVGFILFAFNTDRENDGEIFVQASRGAAFKHISENHLAEVIDSCMDELARLRHDLDAAIEGDDG